MSPSVLATTDHLLIRSLTETDADAIADLWSNPEAMRFMVGPRKPDAIRTAFRELARLGPATQERWWVLQDPRSSGFIGQCGLCPKELEGQEETELVYLVAPAYWGQGFASAAAAEVVRYGREVMRLRRLIALIEPGNVASEVVAGRVGFRHERNTVRPGGRVMKVFVLEPLGTRTA